MKLTNRLNLPDPIIQAIKNDDYDSGDADISVTALISPVRQVALRKRYYSHLEEDASDRIWALLGQSIHSILERANRTGIAERRLSINILGWKVSGGMDLVQEGGHLFDYKITTAWQLLDGKTPESWVEQLNCYAEILRENGEEVTSLTALAILRDHSKAESSRNDGYPKEAVVKRDIPLWPRDKARAFLEERVRAHQTAEAEKLPLCTAKERWARPTKFAVMKQGRKTALKLYDTELEAETHRGDDSTLFIEHRPGFNVRCAMYCDVASFCAQARGVNPISEHLENKET